MTERGMSGQALNVPQSGLRVTPHQAKVLELASTGLSDEQIAARLAVSPRSVRFEFEKVFERLGVRDRVQAITIWNEAPGHIVRPLDRCPYHRPFPVYFSDCPAYRPRRVATLDLSQRPTGSIWTCRNLEGRQIGGAIVGRWFAACAVGVPAARERWAAEHGRDDRLRATDSLAQELASLTGPVALRFWELKQDQAEAVRERRDATPATRAMEALSERFLNELEMVLQRRRTRLNEAGLSIDGCLRFARATIDRLLPEQAPAGWDDRFDVLMRLPEDAWSG
jgi:DNA-binding CsgD family transcriptional regulator